MKRFFWERTTALPRAGQYARERVYLVRDSRLGTPDRYSPLDQNAVAICQHADDAESIVQALNLVETLKPLARPQADQAVLKGA